jgi:hypothetical protein
LSIPLSFTRQSVGYFAKSKSHGDADCTHLAGSAVVPKAARSVRFAAHPTGKCSKELHPAVPIQLAGTTSQRQMEISCVSCLRDSLMLRKGWSSRAAHQATYSALAASTTSSYDVYVRKLQQFCARNQFDFPPTVSGVLAEFFCELCDSSNKPRRVLNMASAAIKNFYKVRDLNCDLIFDADIDKLIKGLVKSGTTVPMARSSAMPASCFSSLFLGWPENSQLSIKDLRLKCLTLMALTLMLRPSDVAPRGMYFHPDTGMESSLIFSTDCLEFFAK